jgi:hypothetical protein
MIPLALRVAIFDEHTRLARLETSAPLLATFGTAMDRRVVPIVHGVRGMEWRVECLPTIDHGGKPCAGVVFHRTSTLTRRGGDHPEIIIIESGLKVKKYRPQFLQIN